MKNISLEIPADEEDCIVVRYSYKLFRFMYDDGRTIDVYALQDDSDLRGEVNKLLKIKDQRIIGVAEVIYKAPPEEQVPPSPPPPPLKDLADAVPVKKTGSDAPTAKKVAPKKAAAKKTIATKVSASRKQSTAPGRASA